MSKGAYHEPDIELLGRTRIYTDASYIDKDNLLTILREAFAIHQKNQIQIAYLLRYEKGVQPLKREKIIRPEIDLRIVDNLANQIVEFKTAYHWGNPITIVQRDDTNLPTEDSHDGIVYLGWLNDAVGMYSLDQELGRYVEITGIGYQMVIPNPYASYNDEYGVDEPIFKVSTLNPMYTFCVYRNDATQKKMMSVTYRETAEGDRYFTCFTDDFRYEVKNLVKYVDSDTLGWSFDETAGSANGMRNPLGRIPVVEYNRSYDMLGCFERQLSHLDALNVEVSDFCNSVAQTTQELWWMNDAELPIDPATGKAKEMRQGMWLITKTAPNGNRPSVQPISSTFDFNGVLENIMNTRNIILQKCYVPIQLEPGGGSTGISLSMSAGWTAAEAVALKQENVIRKSKMELIALELIAIRKSGVVPADDPLMKLRITDLKLKFPRNKTFDLGTKANTLATLLNIGVYGADAFQLVELFGDAAQAWENSKDMITMYQQNRVAGMAGKTSFPNNTGTGGSDGTKRLMSDNTDQDVNSPSLGGYMPEYNYSRGGEIEAAKIR